MEKLDHEKWDGHRRRRKNFRVLTGLLLLTAGALLLARKMGADIPYWIFSWKTFLIVLGVFIGIKDRFRGLGWLVPVLIGTVFLVDERLPEVSLQPYLWPALLIVLGLAVIFKPRKVCGRGQWGEEGTEGDLNASFENTLDTTSVFGGVKKVIASRDFRGGEINCVFGGAEIDLSQADIKGTVVLEANQVFGGTKLIIPRHWNLQSEVTAIMGGIEDKRHTSPETLDPQKTLILKGTCILGGMEIRSY